MDPLTVIVSALALGAAAGLKGTAEQAVKDGYRTLKDLVTSKFSEVDLTQLEKAPESPARRAVVAEELDAAGALGDNQICQEAEALLRKIQKLAPQTAEAIGVDLGKIRTGTLTIKDVVASGTGVKAKEIEVIGDMTLEEIRAGQGGDPPGKV